jgi:hypothetical protein
MHTIFESRDAAGVELFSRMAMTRDDRVFVASPGALEVAYAVTLRHGGEPEWLGALGDLGGRQVWLVDDGLASRNQLLSWLARLRRRGPRTVFLAAPMSRRHPEIDRLVEGQVSVFWVQGVPSDVRLYDQPARDPRWILRALAASSAWQERRRGGHQRVNRVRRPRMTRPLGRSASHAAIISRSAPSSSTSMTGLS